MLNFDKSQYNAVIKTVFARIFVRTRAYYVYTLKVVLLKTKTHNYSMSCSLSLSLSRCANRLVSARLNTVLHQLQINTEHYLSSRSTLSTRLSEHMISCYSVYIKPFLDFGQFYFTSAHFRNIITQRHSGEN